MLQTPKLQFKSHQDFLNQEKQQQLLMDSSKESAKKVEKEKEENVIKAKEKILVDWKSFYAEGAFGDGQGFRMPMYFTWSFGREFFLSPTEDPNYNLNYVWSDPGYHRRCLRQGDNTIRPYYGTMKHFFGPGSWGRDKGRHIVSHYCGANGSGDPPLRYVNDKK